MRWLRLLFALSLVGGTLVAMGISPVTVLAATVVVDGTTYTCTRDGLAGAITDANSGDTVTFDCNGTTAITDNVITFGPKLSYITVFKVIIIDGSNNGGEQIILDGGGFTRFFWIGPDGDVLLQHMSLRNGNGVQGGAILNTGTLAINQCAFVGNQSVLEDVNGSGGAIWNRGTLTISQSRFTGNRGDLGGAIFTSGRLTVSQSTFANNLGDFGGAIAGQDHALLTISDSRFEHNGARYGGAIDNHYGGTAKILRSSFINNQAHKGGVISNWDGNVLLVASTLSGNTADFGSSVWVSEDADITHLAWSTIIQPEEEDTPALDIHGSMAIEGVILGGYGNHCSFVTSKSTLDVSMSLANDDSCDPTQVAPWENQTLLLGPLFTAPNDGVLQSYYALLDESPAIDGSMTADCPSAADTLSNRDQRGNPRPFHFYCDIGAFETALRGQILCAIGDSGLLRFTFANCFTGVEVPIQFTSPAPIPICVHLWSGLARAADKCHQSEQSMLIQRNPTIPVCVNRWSGMVRVSGKCRWAENADWL